MAVFKLWIVQLVSLTGFMYQGTVFVATAATYNFIANQRPRFQIPHGNLSYYNSPQWEVLYFLKFGIFPFYTSSPFFNRTQYLDKIRTIKTLIDRRNAKSGEEDNPNDAEIDLTTVAATTDLPQPHPMTPMIELMPTTRSSTDAQETKYYKNDYFPTLTQLKELGKLKLKRKDKERLTEKKTADIDGDDNMTEELFLNGIDSTPELDYFLVDGDPSWIRSRVAKQAGINPSRGLFTGGSSVGGSSGSGTPGLAAEMTVERKVGRKFQTQGWKK